MTFSLTYLLFVVCVAKIIKNLSNITIELEAFLGSKAFLAYSFQEILLQVDLKLLGEWLDLQHILININASTKFHYHYEYLPN